MGDLSKNGPITGMARIQVEAALQCALDAHRVLCERYGLDEATNTFAETPPAEVRAALAALHGLRGNLENALEEE